MTTTKLHVPLSQLPFDWQRYGALRRKVLAAIEAECDTNRWTLGPHVQAFEEEFAEYIGVKHAIGTNNGTDALFLIMKALGIGAGDRMITSPVTFPATANAIIHTGAKLVFVDIADDYNLSMAYLRELDMAYLRERELKESSESFLLMPVWWGGNPGFQGKMPNDISRICIEDAAQAAGASLNGRMAGSLGIAAGFSLHPLKTLHVLGDGGVVTTNDYGLAEEIRLLRNHGLADRDTCVRNGYNMRLQSIQAIVAIHTLKLLDEWNEGRVANARRYDEGLRDIPGITLPPRDPNVRHVFHLWQCETESKDVRDRLLKHLRDADIEAAVHYPTPLHLQPAFARFGYERGSLPRAERFCDTHISLPVGHHLTEQQVNYVIDTIRGFYGV